jgi:hypothetical protein
MPAPPRRKDSFEEAVRKAFKAVPPDESFDQEVDKAFRELDKKGGKGKGPRK